MYKVKIELNSSQIRDFLRSKEVMDECERTAKSLARKCGKGYAVDTHVGINRVNASVYPETYEAVIDNLRNKTLKKVIKG